MTTQTKAPSVKSIVRKLFNTSKKLGNTAVVVLDTTADVISDTVDLSTSAVAAIPSCVKETGNLYKYSKAGYIHKESSDSEHPLTFEDALKVVEEDSWNSMEDMFKDVGNKLGSLASSTKTAFNDEE